MFGMINVGRPTKAVFQGMQECFKDWVNIVDGRPDNAFLGLVEDFLDDWQEAWRVTSHDVDEFVFKRVVNSKVIEVAGEEGSPGRWLSDHYKSKRFNPHWTMRRWCYFLYLAFRGKLTKSIWGNHYQQKMKELALRSHSDRTTAADALNPNVSKQHNAKGPARCMFSVLSLTRKCCVIAF